MTIEVEDIKRLAIHPGETLLVWLDSGIDTQAVEDCAAAFRQNLPTGVKCLLIAADMRVEVVANDALPE